MCGRFTANVKKKDLEEEWNLAVPPEFRPRYNIAPSQVVGVITNKQPSALSLFHWGLIPSWAKDNSMASHMINARVETLNEKPSFRKLAQTARCLVPATSWFEWMQDKSRQPFAIKLKNAKLFALAGLWDTWIDAGGQKVNTFTIITTNAAPGIRHIHERMPLVVPKELQQDWLSNKTDAITIATESGQLEFDFYPVSSRVNSPKNDDESLLDEFRETLL
ncbi:MAG TPA: SOS response-associated peptidase [Bacteroidales bacterium]|nr:SOS response-associated peptidase [Bacteroidales bacterium]